ncbi:MAG: dipeptidase [Ardenticatenales bacterium]|nr:dipeptidase [Ardenticatenales bacterium]
MPTPTALAADPRLTAALAAAHADRAGALARLVELLRIPSVSTVPEHAPDVRAAAAWVAARMRSAGLTGVRIDDTPRHPVVYGERIVDASRPTVLIYGHYDVQPVDPLDLWQTPPFEPTERDGALYARGSSDDKGQVMANLEAIAAWEATGGLPVNVKLVIEGEEEIGSPNLEGWMRAHADALAADVALVSDTAILAPGTPSIVYALRGLCYVEIEVEGPRRDLHSGQYGGAVANPANALCHIVNQLLDQATGRILIPGFYDRVRPIDPAERAELARAPFDLGAFGGATGDAGGWGDADYSIVERLGARPTLDVNGLVSGWTGAGAKTVLPAKALAKVSMRLVPDQDPDEIVALITEHVASIAPPHVKVTVRNLHGARPALADRDTVAIRAAAAAYEIGFGRAPYYMREGGSIPVVALMADVLGIDTVLMGFGLPDDNLHAPNERFVLDQYERGVDTAIAFHAALAAGSGVETDNEGAAR